MRKSSSTAMLASFFLFKSTSSHEAREIVHRATYSVEIAGSTLKPRVSLRRECIQPSRERWIGLLPLATSRPREKPVAAPILWSH
jgi:hypothetical protein